MADLQIDLDGIRIRPYRDTDIPSLVSSANNPRVARDLREAFPHPYTEQDARSWLETCRRLSPVTHFAIADDAENAGVIGGIGVIPGTDVHRIEAELGYWLAEPFWGRGIMTRAVSSFAPAAASRFGFQRIFARVFSRNRASAAVLEKSGFALEGLLRSGAIKDGLVLDEYLYARVFS
jgi:RimJ/RimL family protein N-acetyltransferase